MPVRAFKSGFGSTDTPGEVIALYAETTASAQHSTFRSDSTPTYYQVPAGKTFYITRIIHVNDAATGSSVFGYGDTAVNNDTTAPTNVKQKTKGFKVEVANREQVIDCFIPIPTGKYPYFKSSGNAGGAQVFGIEV
jgi:hypothetical protein